MVAMVILITNLVYSCVDVEENGMLEGICCEDSKMFDVKV